MWDANISSKMDMATREALYQDLLSFLSSKNFSTSCPIRSQNPRQIIMKT
nr:hypothetical protein Iba_chr11cCG3220 [Ipomoea batatas]GMD58334.1 hypothetical protein Iba_chr11fCG4580 [Ipomoea batatas]